MSTETQMAQLSLISMKKLAQSTLMVPSDATIDENGFVKATTLKSLADHLLELGIVL